MRLLLTTLFALLVIAPLHAEDKERARLLGELSRTLQNLTEYEDKAASALGAVGITMPGAVSDALAARRTIAQDWQRRLGDDQATIEIGTAKQFQRDLSQVYRVISNLAAVAWRSRSALEQYPHFVNHPAMARFLELLKRRIEDDLAGIAAGRSRSDDELAGDSRAEQPHYMLLGMLEIGRSTAESFLLVSSDDPLRGEFNDSYRIACGALERAIARGAHSVQDVEQLNQLQQLVWQHTRLMQIEQNLRERRADKRLVGSAALTEVVARSSRETTAVRALLAQMRGRNPIDEESQQRIWKSNQALERERELSDFAIVWCDRTGRLADIRRAVDKRMARSDVPVDVQATVRARIDSLTGELTTIDAALVKAMAAGDRLAVIIADCEFGHVLQHLDDQHHRIYGETYQASQWIEAEAQGQSMRSDPTVAAALKRLTSTRQDLAAQRAKIEQAEAAAMRLRIESEVMKARADSAANQAQQLFQDSVGNEETLKEIVNQLAKAAKQAQEKPSDVKDF